MVNYDKNYFLNNFDISSRPFIRYIDISKIYQKVKGLKVHPKKNLWTLYIWYYYEKKNLGCNSRPFARYIDIMKIYRKYIKSEGVEVRPQICFYELFIYDIIMGKFFWSITPLPSLDILIYKKYIGKYISIYREKGQFLHHQIFFS